MTQHTKFKEAKKIALTIEKGCYTRRGNYKGFRDHNNRMWVIGDTDVDIQNPDAIINGCPAREIFGNFTIMRATN